ncbi:hypothetical protein B0J18DRAFT_470273 [Chaetomium sp. MPI-SDFR-AT-0129]|nr:hypothetical protein B0J18DRAFT_470273 [Chaetomium sp. MPI-SDFR-AT-0129]
MPNITRSIRDRLPKKKQPPPPTVTTPPPPLSPTAPTVSWLLAHRNERITQSALTKGQTPLASLYRMYEYLTIGHIKALRSEIERFFNHPSWAVSAIPDPADPDPQRYAILAGIPSLLVTAFNRLIERGLPRGSPSIITGVEMEEELRRRPVVLETEPAWVGRVPALREVLVLPGPGGEVAEGEERYGRLLRLGVVVGTPHVLFV